MKLREIARNEDNIIIYGAGEYGTFCKKWMEADEDFAEKNIMTAVTENIDRDFDVYEIKDLQEYKEDCLVVVAVSKEKQATINEILKKYGFVNIYNMSRRVYLFMKNSVINREQKILQAIKQDKIINLANEILWGMNFQNAMNSCAWMQGKSIKANGAAVGYYYLYTLYKALESGKFKSVLDIGMGQTTKMISQYVKQNENIKHFVVEGDAKWIEFAKHDLDLSCNTKILLLETVFGGSDGKVRIYKGFKEALKNKTFDLISIDGPQGYDMKNESRIDILEILPECLEKSFVMLIDDVDRLGESNLLQNVLKILGDNEIEYTYMLYTGITTFAVITSLDNKFFCSV